MLSIENKGIGRRPVSCQFTSSRIMGDSINWMGAGINGGSWQTFWKSASLHKQEDSLPHLLTYFEFSQQLIAHPEEVIIGVLWATVDQIGQHTRWDCIILATYLASTVQEAKNQEQAVRPHLWNWRMHYSWNPLQLRISAPRKDLQISKKSKAGVRTRIEDQKSKKRTLNRRSRYAMWISSKSRWEDINGRHLLNFNNCTTYLTCL